MKVFRNIFLLLIFLFPWTRTTYTSIVFLAVQAYPFGAGHCSSGTAIGNSSHGTTGSGSLRNGNYQIRVIQSGIISSTVNNDGGITLIPGPPTFLSTGTDYTMSLTIRDSTIPTNQFFRGFLFRLSGKQGENVKDAMIISPDFRSSGQEQTMCSSNVSGVTHTNASDKTTVDVLLRFDQPIPQVQLEVTVVQSNSPSGSNLWYYDSYDLVILQAPSTDAPTCYPSAEPSTTIKSSNTGEPSSSESHNPSSVPSFNPSLVSTVSPSRVLPSVYPSVNIEENQSSVPSLVPSKGPSLLPSLTPSKALSLSPTLIPSKRPSISPSLAPSQALSLWPSLTPSKGPSFLPSLTPSQAISENPTTSPSSMEPTTTTISTISAATRSYGVPLPFTTICCIITLISCVVW